MERVCLQCGRAFSLLPQELEKYEENGLEIPSFCSVCRRKNRRKETVVVEKRISGPAGLFLRKKGKNKPNPLSMVFRGRFMLPALAALLIFGVVSGNRMLENRKNTPEATEQEVKIFSGFDALELQYEQNGKAMGYTSAEEYLAGANELISNPDAVCQKQGEETVYFLSSEKQTVILSADGYIRTYFQSSDAESQNSD